MDEKELDNIIKKYSPLVYTVISGILGKEKTADIEEVASDVFSAFWFAKKYDTSDSGIRALLVTISRHHAVNRAKQLRKNVWEELSDEIADAGLTDSEVSEKIQAKIIKEVIDSLTPPDNEIFTRRYYYCQSVKSIAANLGVKPKFVENRLYYAKSKIRKELLKRGIDGTDS